MITYEDLCGMTRSELDKYYANLLSKVERDNQDYITNTQFIPISSNADGTWSSMGHRHFNMQDYYYRLVPEPEIIDMSDEECREFIRGNITGILIRRKNTYGIDKHASAYLDCTFIASHNVFCFIEDFNCKKPDDTVWKEFKKTVMEQIHENTSKC